MADPKEPPECPFCRGALSQPPPDYDGLPHRPSSVVSVPQCDLRYNLHYDCFLINVQTRGAQDYGVRCNGEDGHIYRYNIVDAFHYDNVFVFEFGYRLVGGPTSDLEATRETTALLIRMHKTLGQNIAQIGHLVIRSNAANIDEVRGVVDEYLPINTDVLATGLKDDCTITVLNVGTRRSSKHVFKYDQNGNPVALNLVKDKGGKLVSIFRTTARDASASPSRWTQSNLVNEYSLSATTFMASSRPEPRYSCCFRSKNVEKQLL